MGRRHSAAWEQLEMQAARGKNGGLRRNSGRKPSGRKTVDRGGRPTLKPGEPCHVTLRLKPGAPHLRRHHTYRTLRAVFRLGKDRFGFRLVHYSVQSNHLHLICEAADNKALSRGMQGLAIRVARQVNRISGRKGKLFADRYHLRVLDCPTKVRNCLIYVLRNAVHHGAAPPGRCFDVYSSALFFDGWKEKLRIPVVHDGDLPVMPPRVWLLAAGWRKAGEISLDDVPR
jgi:REP element-mobilizing transposase RayT